MEFILGESPSQPQPRRRRKIKCNYPPTPPSSPSSTSEAEKKCIECTTHKRTCQIQGYVASETAQSDSHVENSAAVSSDTAAQPNLKSSLKPKIYKRRRQVDRTSPDASEDERPRMKMHFDRMAPVVERIAKERGSAHVGASTAPGPLAPYSGGAVAWNGEIPLSGGYEFGFNTSSPFANAFTFDIGSDSSVDAPKSWVGDGFETFFVPSSLSGEPAVVASDAQSTREGELGFGIQPQRSNLAKRVGLDPLIPLEQQSKKSSPLLCQLFNNEIFTQATPTPQILTEKVQTLSFSDTNTTDAEKLLSTINSEPYLLEVLDISIKWWIAWRDQAFALQDVFAFSKEDQWLSEGPSCSSYSDTSTNTSCASPSRSSPCSSGAMRTYSGDQPISLRDFVMLKLSHSEDPVSISTGLLCVALSLSQLRSGVDDSVLNISTTPAEVAERITLAVDTIVLSPYSKPEYMSDAGVLLLLMMRAKMFAESNQLRKSWLSLRQAIEVAKKIGFTEPRVPLDAGDLAARLCPGALTKLFHRQRFVGSIMELDRLMSLVLGFPHAQDGKFTDRLAMTVLRGQAPLDANGSKPHVSADIKMRALRRVVSIAAGHVNDRNGSAEADDAKYQTTMDIQKTLNEAAAAMPDGWWDVNSHIHYADPFVAHEHLVAQMWFWQVQAFLHLPFMMKPCSKMRSSDPHHKRKDDLVDEYLINRYLCLQGCRGMMRIFTLLRSDPSLAVFICACEDFQGVFSACILMVGILIRLAFCPQTLRSPNADVMGSVNEDLALIGEIKDVFRYRAVQQGGCISKQGLKVLEELGSFLHEDSPTDDGQPLRRTVVLPYFGAIHLELRPPRHLRCKSMDMDSRESSTATDPTPPSSTEHSVDGGFDLDPANMTHFAIPGFDVNTASQATGPDGNVDWDHFIFGTELGQDWEAQIPEWPADESLWEWN
ncbi:hypothetical protein G647_01648 [Cladophialophora carrionii CBS 160.54]|uniref:Transcription factor domain-containing protein n=1 Tax=Cladophialophora carrionii CBS 160.54 TaxID=1279043 RepID=V9DQN0_9EURO|nr:uncharacterized protein G647_01648 [Cladophialophora carrionii CBS 160.54]ETI29195.1 hypothetical protein G647_01648 [Cladophialophora carrionii CBS 160.54]